jgi:hypothetical protein
MANRSNRLINFLAIVVLSAAVFTISTHSTLFAETYTVPQTTEVTLAWDANASAPDGYRIYQRTEGQAYDYTQPVWEGASTSCTVYNLAYDTTYYFVARAYVGADESADSGEVSFSTPLAANYTILASINGDGAISPAGTVTVVEGTDQSFTITPNAGSTIVDVFVDGVSVGAVSTYTFTQVSQNHTVSADFDYITYTISASADTGGSISPTGSVSVNDGSSQGYTITPSAGYQVADVLVDGASVGPVSTYTFDQVSENHSIHATFIVDTVTIASFAGTNGTISPVGSVNVLIGGSQTFTITPDSGYVVSDVWVDGVSVGAVDAYTFSSVTTDHTINAAFSEENQAPTADAGPDQTVEEGKTVVLSGLNSIDPDDGIVAFQWVQIQGDPVALTSSNEPETTFTTPNVDSSGAALVFELTVTDYSGAISTDSCIVNVTWVNLPPNADAGVDQTVQGGDQVLLDASNSTDADDGIASYAWKQVSGPVVALSSTDSAAPFFIAPDVESAGGSLAFEVTVTDNGGLQDTATCLINVTWVNTPPVADAGSDQSATAGDDVFLDGSNSYDADDTTITSYRWYQTNGVPVELSDATAVSPVFTVPVGAEDGGPLVFELTVTDGGGLQAKDRCQVNVQSMEPTLHVSMITIQLKQKGPNVEANASVTILDDAGNIVKDAMVTGHWTYNGDPMNTVTKITRGDGVAVLLSDKVRARSGAEFAIEITGVAKDGYIYDSAANTVTQEMQIFQ